MVHSLIGHCIFGATFAAAVRAGRGVESSRYAGIAFSEPPRFAGRVT